jgi:hypothetical protein
LVQLSPFLGVYPVFGDAELAALNSERATIRPRLNKAAQCYEAGEIDDEQLAIISKGLRQRENEITAALAAANMRSPLDVLLGADSVERMWDEVLTMGQNAPSSPKCSP